MGGWWRLGKKKLTFLEYLALPRILFRIFCLILIKKRVLSLLN